MAKGTAVVGMEGRGGRAMEVQGMVVEGRGVEGREGGGEGGWRERRGG